MLWFIEQEKDTILHKYSNSDYMAFRLGLGMKRKVFIFSKNFIKKLVMTQSL
jgi:hypothetical protein